MTPIDEVILCHTWRCSLCSLSYYSDSKSSQEYSVEGQTGGRTCIRFVSRGAWLLMQTVRLRWKEMTHEQILVDSSVWSKRQASGCPHDGADSNLPKQSQQETSKWSSYGARFWSTNQFSNDLLLCRNRVGGCLEAVTALVYLRDSTHANRSVFAPQIPLISSI